MTCEEETKESRFRELLKQFHKSQDMGRVELERIYRSSLAFRIPVLEHYREGRASYIFDVEPTFKLEKVGKGKSGIVGFPRPYRAVLVCHADTFDVGVMDYGNQESVLVSDVEFVHGPDGKIPSIMRLYIGRYESEEIGSGEVYLSIAEGSFHVLRGGVGRELGILPVSAGDNSRNSFVPSMIKSALQIMNGIPDDCRDVVKGSVLDFWKVYFDEFASSARLYMGSNQQSFLQSINRMSQLRNMFVGPFDLETCSFVDRHTNLT
jgi:hypothetical protein